jgi:hypothetical protein
MNIQVNKRITNLAAAPLVEVRFPLHQEWSNICCVEMQLTFILKTTAAYSANLAVMTSIDQMAWYFGDYYYPESADNVKYILEDIFVCSIKEQCSDQEESEGKC